MPTHLKKLFEQIERLCARCDYLYREVSRLREENRQLRQRCENAKTGLTELLARLPRIEK